MTRFVLHSGVVAGALITAACVIDGPPIDAPETEQMVVDPGPCPPEAEVGNDATIGAVIENIQLANCDADVVTVHSMCPRKAAWLFVYADW